jgi:hypothetical protein
MNLSDAILNCLKYEDSDEFMHQVFAKKIDGKFEPGSQASVLKLTLEEMEMKIVEISNLKCPGYDYFLELFLLQDIYSALVKSDEYKSDEDKVKRIIYYAEFDA